MAMLCDACGGEKYMLVIMTLILSCVLFVSWRMLAPKYKAATPNEWLVIIRNGEQRLAGVGLKARVW